MRVLLVCAVIVMCSHVASAQAQNRVAPVVMWHHNLDIPEFATPLEACLNWVPHLHFNAVFHHLEPNPQEQGARPAVPFSCWVRDTLNGVWLSGIIYPSYRCPAGFPLDPSLNKCDGPADTVNPNKQCGEPRADQPRTCNPIALGTGNKYFVEEDYAGAGSFPLTLKRYYTSAAEQGSARGTQSVFSGVIYSPTFNGSETFSPNWRSTYDRSIELAVTLGRAAFARREDGRVRTFILVNGAWVGDPDTTDRLVRKVSNGVPAGWEYTSGDDDVVETYDVAGRLVALTNRQGLTQTITYNALDRVSTVTDAFGRSLAFGYEPAVGRLRSVTLPDGGVIAYAYDAAANLILVTYPDGRARQFHYNEAALTAGANLPHALTGITGENGTRFGNYGYATDGRAVLSEHAGGAIRTTISYSGTNSIATDAFNQTRTYGYSVVNGLALNTSIAGPVCPTCGPASRTYDANGFPASSIDWNGNRTNYTRDSRGLETKRVEGLTSGGATTSVTRTVTTEWHATYRLPVRVAEPFRVTTFVYGAPTDSNPGNRGSLLTKSVQPTTDATGSAGFSAVASGSPRLWTYTYNANGQMLTVDGPRTDVSDVTTYEYYLNDATCGGASVVGCRGQIASIMNALGHVTTFDEYNAHGQPLRTTDPNGLVTTTSYDARMRMTNRTVGEESTSYAYDAAGQLTQITLPDGSFLAYTYDAAHRLTAIQDSQGNRIAYTLDALGNRVKEDVVDSTGALSRTRARVYSNLNRLLQDIGAQNQAITYAYDNQGNVTSIDGPLAGAVDVRTNAYDALNRLVRVTDPNGGQVSYGYDGRDHLVSVSDPRALTTTYVYDGLDNLNQLVSPDTGNSVTTYDAAGNVSTVTDATGQQTRYAYDALNRVTKVEYFGPGPALTATHNLIYDGGNNQKGRLTQIQEPASTTSYAYDQKGRVTSEVRTISGIAYTTSYGYDAQGRLSSVTYPGGRVIAYAFDTLGRVQAITSEKDNVRQVIVSNVLYQPFGAARTYTFGNGQTYARGYDTDGRISSYTLATQTIAVQYDPASRISSLGQLGVPASNSSYGYDALDRLTSYIGANTNQSFGYDAVGNRTFRTAGDGTSTYAYGGTNNRLTSVSGAGARTYTHDALGSVKTDGISSFAYDTRGRLVQASNAAGAIDYSVNALGQRIRKSGAQSDTVFHYDVQGRLIAESTAVGQMQKEYVYLGDIPVAVLQ